MTRSWRQPLSHETHAFLLALAAGVPALAVATWFILREVADPTLRWTLSGFVTLAWIGGALAVRDRVTRPLQSLSNILAALRERDFTMRARGADPESALGLALWEINALADTLRRQRLDALEATGLLRSVMDSIDVAVFAFDEQDRLSLLNRDGEALLAMPVERAHGSSARALGLADTLSGETPRLVELRLPGKDGRWELRRGVVRQDGRPHRLIVLSDVSRSLREEEREAWRRLVRVLSHEINNSLAPIQSIAGSLRSRLEKPGEGGAREQDLREGLEVVESRAQSLSRFLQAYARLARLPRPVFGDVAVAPLVRRVAALETRLPVEVEAGPEVRIRADADQIEQALINLVRNAADSVLATGGGVRVRWNAAGGLVTIEVEDDGAGVADASNLFVPFYTTKDGGTGIGLPLSRQIAEAHGGSLSLDNRAAPGHGCQARLRLPREARAN